MPAKPRLHAAPATVVSLAVILAVAVTALAALNNAEAAGGQPQCGDTITADTTLHHNLANCPNNGIIIGADNVTVDLNYHTIDGDGKLFAGCAQGEICDSGVVDDGYDGLTNGFADVFGLRPIDGTGGIKLRRILCSRPSFTNASNAGVAIRAARSTSEGARSSAAVGGILRPEILC